MVTKIAILWPKSTLALQDWKYMGALLGSWLSAFAGPAGLGGNKLVTI